MRMLHNSIYTYFMLMLQDIHPAPEIRGGIQLVPMRIVKRAFHGGNFLPKWIWNLSTNISFQSKK